MAQRKGGIQATFDGIKGKINTAAAQGIEERLQDIAEYAVSVSPVDTGAYVNSFSMLRASSGGGRKRSSANKPRQQNPEAMKQGAIGQLYSDIEALNVKQDLEDGNARFTLRNRSEHARDVEDGENWKRTDGYYVFTKTKRKFG